MSKFLRTLFCLSIMGCFPAALEGEAAPKTAAAEGSVELTGTVHTSPEGYARLEIFPDMGTMKWVDLHSSDALRGIPDGTAVWVRGVFRTQIIGPAEGVMTPLPTQWMIWLDVSEVRKFATVYEAFREPHERYLNGTDGSHEAPVRKAIILRIMEPSATMSGTAPSLQHIAVDKPIVLFGPP